MKNNKPMKKKSEVKTAKIKAKRLVKAAKKVTRDEKIRAELRELRKDIKKAKKSKRKLQFLWYRTKKEHVALIKDVETRLKVVKKSLAKK